MAFVVPTKDNQSSYSSNTQKIDDEDDYADQPPASQTLHLQQQHLITSQLYLKSTHSSGKLEKDHVVRSIRHRRRMNKARSFLQKLQGPAHGEAEPASPHEKRWFDDAFSAP